MKKSVKLLALATAIVAMSCCVLQTNAQDTKEVKLEILEWSSACTWDNYDFSGYNVSATDTELDEVSHLVDCVLLSTSQAHVNVQIDGPLKSTENTATIPASRFTYTTLAWIKNGSLDADTAETTAVALDQPTSIYDKGSYKVWNLTGITLKLDGTIPWGTPKWVYTWELHITVQDY